MAALSMKLFTTAKEMLLFSDNLKEKGGSIGYVPTMGALHSGHLELMKTARKQHDRVVVSVFVNPTQFNDLSDLEKYPRTFEADRALLEAAGIDAMFFPSVDEVYPNKRPEEYDMAGLDQRMEGPNRPGHFNGVVQVVMRLFDIIKPDAAYFGEKDFQQLTIIKHMSHKLGSKVTIVGCPTVRGSNGLALSSRNARLSDGGKTVAVAISECLSRIKVRFTKKIPLDEILQLSTKELENTVGLRLEYLEFVDPGTLLPADDSSSSIRACVAAWVEDVRLIDNMQVK